MAMQKIELKTDAGHAGKTVKHMALKVVRLSESCFRSLKFSGGILLDGKRAMANDRVKEGQVLAFLLPEQNKYTTKNDSLLSVKIVYEDDDYYVIDKPAPLPTMKSAKQEGDTLQGRIEDGKGILFRPVNRLDKGTSGLMVAAKGAYAQQRLQKMLHTDDFVREYVAVCDGVPTEEEGLIDLPIGKGNGVKRCIDPDGKEAKTFFRVLKKGKNRALVQLRLKTGRTHQIRVHMAAMGHPVTGDYLYGKEHPLLEGRFSLHSGRVRFIQPITGKEIDLTSPVPEKWQMLLDEKGENT